MRVTAGKFKGRNLIDNKYEHIRPTADMVKQAIFNKLAFDLPGSRVLDLFCGTGALGIEALSRGAREVVFVDKDPRSVALTKANLEKLGIKEGFHLYKASYETALEKLEGQFDIIILDPPYASGLYETCVKKIAEKNLLLIEGIIVVEHEKRDNFDYSPFNVVDEKTYGIKTVTYLKIDNYGN